MPNGDYAEGDAERVDDVCGPRSRARGLWGVCRRADAGELKIVGSATWDEHQGRPYLHVRWRCTDERQLVALMNQVVAAAQGTPERLAIIGDATGMLLWPGFLAVAKRANRDVFGPRGTLFLVYGMNGVTAAAARGFSYVGGGTRILPCRDKQHALIMLGRLYDDPSGTRRR